MERHKKLVKLVDDLRQLNPQGQFTVVDIDGNDIYYGVGVMGMDIGAVTWPVGYRINHDNQLTNKHSCNGCYVSFDIYQLVPFTK